jgi:hypothetical protein
MRSRSALVALCVGLNVAESALIFGLDRNDAPSLATQASAIVPFGTFHDLRWMSVFQTSWLTFVAELVAMLLVRAAITALSVSLAWPRSYPRPTFVRLFVQGLLATFVSAVFVAPCVALLFGLAVVPISWLFIAAVPLILLVALVVHPIAVHGSWWRRALSPRALLWVFATFVVLDLAAVATTAAPAPVRLVVAAAAGVFNAWAWVGLVSAVVVRAPARRIVPMVPAALAALVGLVIGGTVLGFNGAHPAAPLYSASDSPSDASGTTPLMIVSGYGSTWNGVAVHPIPGNFYEVRFSYKGLAADGRPLPYDEADTVRPLDQLERMLADQVEVLYRQTHRRVDIASESEGALITETYVLADRGAPVRTAVYASPLVDPGRVWYPVSQTAGWGVASAEAMDLLGRAFQSVAPIDLSPHSSFLASLDEAAPLLQTMYSCEVPGVRQFALLPLADSVADPPGATFAFPSAVVPAFHGGLIPSAQGSAVISKVLQGQAVSTSGIWEFLEDTVRDAATAWQVPDLPASDFPGGKADPGACSALVHDLATYFDSAR